MAFGRPIGANQAVAFKVRRPGGDGRVARAASSTGAAGAAATRAGRSRRRRRWQALRDRGRGHRHPDATQIFGGYGFIDETLGGPPVPRRQDPRDRRGHQRDPAPRDQPGARLAGVVARARTWGACQDVVQGRLGAVSAALPASILRLVSAPLDGASPPPGDADPDPSRTAAPGPESSSTSPDLLNDDIMATVGAETKARVASKAQPIPDAPDEVAGPAAPADPPTRPIRRWRRPRRRRRLESCRSRRRPRRLRTHPSQPPPRRRRRPPPRRRSTRPVDPDVRVGRPRRRRPPPAPPGRRRRGSRRGAADRIARGHSAG